MHSSVHASVVRLYIEKKHYDQHKHRGMVHRTLRTVPSVFLFKLGNTLSSLLYVVFCFLIVTFKGNCESVAAAVQAEIMQTSLNLSLLTFMS